jgi:hypothetical protein
LFSVNALEQCEKIIAEEETIEHDLRAALKEFESRYENYKNASIYETQIKRDFELIEKNHTSRTTNSAERKTRISLIYKYLI